MTNCRSQGQRLPHVVLQGQHQGRDCRADGACGWIVDDEMMFKIKGLHRCV